MLRALDPYLSYRKGPFALYALSEYIGEERVNGALRRLLEKHRPAEAPLATTLDLYRELQAVTPDSLQYLLHDLFEVNTFWELETERVTAEQTEAGTWQVTLDVRARKVVVDSAGVETEVPMNEWVEIGIFDDKRLERAALPAEAPHPLRHADDHGDGAAQARARRHRPGYLLLDREDGRQRQGGKGSELIQWQSPRGTRADRRGRRRAAHGDSGAPRREISPTSHATLTCA